MVHHSPGMRLDKWLWAVRLFKTRSLATAACQAGHVKIDGQRVKPAREIRPGDILTAYNGHLHRTVKVLALLAHRVGAQLVPGYLEDLTPPEEYERARLQKESSAVPFPRGLGRPTKKQRRQLERLL